jgi:serine/threonine-protein kinase HipA
LALGYQQMRVGRDGADATLENALAEHRSFALTHARAQAVATEVARVVAGRGTHFAEKGASPRDIDLLGEQIDRAFLCEQRAAAG